MRQSEFVDALQAALVVAQGAYPVVPKSATNPFFNSKYADLAACVEAAKPVNLANGLAVTQMPALVDGKPVLTSRLIHESGQWMEDDMPLFMGKQDAQSLGSALTYARRYAFVAILGLVADEDDDGNAASAKPKRAKPAHDDPSPANSDPTDVGELVKRKGRLGAVQRGALMAWAEEHLMPLHPKDMSGEERDVYLAKIIELEAS